MDSIHVKNSQPLKSKPRRVSPILDSSRKREMCEIHKPELLVISQGQTCLEDHPVSTQQEKVREAKLSPLGISAYQTKCGEEQLTATGAKMAVKKQKTG